MSSPDSLAHPSVLQHANAVAPGRWLAALAVAFLGYATLGKGFAYIGLPPLFLSEILLMTGVAIFLTLPTWRRVLSMPPMLLLLLLGAWTILCTLPYLGIYGIDAVRDAMLVGYSLFAACVAAVILAEPRRLGLLLHWYRRASPVIVLSVPLLFALEKVAGDAIPTWPWAGVGIISTKGGDSLVQLAGILALWVAGLAGRVPLWQILLMAAAVPLIGSENRGGLLTVLLVGAVTFSVRPRAAAMRNLLGIVLVILALLLVSNFSMQVPGRDREISARQVVMNVASIVIENEETESLQGTKEWRLNWWRDIVNYTVFGEHFWQGKGFGINLATDDGFQVSEEEALRSPHNGHMTVLARAGVPGFVLWVLVQVSWGVMMAQTFLTAQRRRDVLWSRVLLFLGAFWMAFLVNASFDVYLENPMGAVPFWTVFGTGLAAMVCYRVAPEAIEPPEDTDQTTSLRA